VRGWEDCPGTAPFCDESKLRSKHHEHTGTGNGTRDKHATSRSETNLHEPCYLPIFGVLARAKRQQSTLDVQAVEAQGRLIRQKLSNLRCKRLRSAAAMVTVLRLSACRFRMA
jgi:hypothetical protein